MHSGFVSFDLILLMFAERPSGVSESVMLLGLFSHRQEVTKVLPESVLVWLHDTVLAN
jgi:hypothetical protein